MLSLDSGHRDGSNALNKPSVWWQTVAKVSWQWRDIFTRPPEAFCSGRGGRTSSNQNTRTVPMTFHWTQLLALWQPTGQTLLTGKRRREKCVCVCVLVYATLRGPNVPTRIVKPEFFDIVGTSLWSPRGNKWLKIVNDVYLKA